MNKNNSFSGYTLRTPREYGNNKAVDDGFVIRESGFQPSERSNASRRKASSRGNRPLKSRSNSSCSLSSRLHSLPSIELTRLNFSSSNPSSPLHSTSANSGTLPIGVSTPCALPWQRSTIHFNTRMFSPNPGQMNLPSASVRNQLTQKIRGRLGTERPSLSQWLK